MFSTKYVVPITMKGSALQWRYRHVKGHQNNNLAADLDQWTSMNIKMDLVAKEVLHYAMERKTHLEADIQDEGWTIYLHNKNISSVAKIAFYDHIYQAKATSWWKDKTKRFTEDGQEVVDWQVIRKALKELKSPRS